MKQRIFFIVIVLLFSSSYFFILPFAHALKISREITSFGRVIYSVNQRTLTATKVDNLYPLTDAEREALASNYDLLITGDWNEKYLPTLHEINPELKIFIYRAVPQIDNRSVNEIEVARSNGWILKDVYGNEVTRTGNENMKVADIGNPDYVAWLANLMKGITDNPHVAGIFADVTQVRIRRVSAIPVNPRTGQLYADEDWSRDLTTLVRTVRLVTGKLYIANGVGMLCGSHDAGYYANKELSDPVIAEADGVLLEGFIRFSDDDWRLVDDWKKDIEYLDDLNNKGKITLAWTITYGDLPPDTSKYQVAMYGYVTYLLCRSGDMAYFTARGYEESFLSVTKIDLGYPIEEYHELNGGPVHEREFSKALVLLNPSDNSFIIPLEGSYVTLNGQTVSEIELSAHTGIILIKKY